MLIVLSTLVIIIAFLLMSEQLWRVKKLKGETARKTVQVVTGICVAIWPYFVSWRVIQIISTAAIVAVFFIRQSGLFKSFYDVGRFSWGELLGALTISVIAFLEPPVWVFVAAVLHFALADTAAALVGKTLGKSNHYKIFGQSKSVAGTLAFWVVSVIIVSGLLGLSTIPDESFIPIVLAVSAATTALENLSPYGSDNFFVPIFVVATLSTLQSLS